MVRPSLTLGCERPYHALDNPLSMAEGPRAWDGIQRTGYERRARREGEGRSSPRPRHVGLAGIVLIAIGLPFFLVGYRASLYCPDLPSPSSCVPFPLFWLLVIVLGIAFVTASFMFQNARVVPRGK